MPRSLPSSTRERILATAGAVFARQGLAAPLRAVTAAAGVNLAAVNYHFGSKDALVQEVVRRRLDQLAGHRQRALAAVQARPGHTLEDVLQAFIAPALDELPAGNGAFLRVLARAWAEDDTHLRRVLSRHFGAGMRAFVDAISALLPALPRAELLWRLDLLAGALTYAMAGSGMIQRPPTVAPDSHRAVTVQQLVRFGAAGLRAP